MNEQAKLQRIPEATVAAHFLNSALGIGGYARVSGFWEMIGRRHREHLYLVTVFRSQRRFVVAVPLGVSRRRLSGSRAGLILGMVAVIYTIPSLALLAFMVPLLGIGAWPAIVALFLYSLLPIVRNTHAGLRGIPPAVENRRRCWGCRAGRACCASKLPLASASILAGIQTSAVINVGTATLGRVDRRRRLRRADPHGHPAGQQAYDPVRRNSRGRAGAARAGDVRIARTVSGPARIAIGKREKPDRAGTLAA